MGSGRVKRGRVRRGRREASRRSRREANARAETRETLREGSDARVGDGVARARFYPQRFRAHRTDAFVFRRRRRVGAPGVARRATRRPAATDAGAVTRMEATVAAISTAVSFDEARAEGCATLSSTAGGEKAQRGDVVARETSGRLCGSSEHDGVPVMD